MFCVVYEFKAKPAKLESFKRAWAAHTQILKTVCGALGSRLHSTADPLTFVAYAQWPSKAAFDSSGQHAYDPGQASVRDELLESLESSRRVYMMDVVEDLLIK